MNNFLNCTMYLGKQIINNLCSQTTGSSKIIPEKKIKKNLCEETKIDIKKIESKTSAELLKEFTDDDKISIVLTDPKFGMFSLFKYQLIHGIKNEFTKEHDTIYCSHVFSLWCAIPVLIFIAQWIIYTTLVVNQIQTYKDGLCPNQANVQEKLLMFAIAILYFCKSFFLWDNILSRSKKKFVLKTNSMCAVFDTLQEFGFNILVYLTNLIIIFTELDFMNMVMNSLAMEFLMMIDNEFEETYFKYQPEVAIDIFDKMFVSYKENKDFVANKMKKNCYFRVFKYITYVPYKLIILFHIALPVICLFMVFYGPVCK